MQPIMAGNPTSSWWSLNNNNNIRPPSQHHHQQQLPLFSSPSFFPAQFDHNSNTPTSSPPPPSSSSPSSTSSSSTASSSSSAPFSSSSSYHHNQLGQLPESWSQLLLLGGLVGGVDPAAAATGLNQVILQENNKGENPWEDRVAMHHYIKQENSSSSSPSNYLYLIHGDHHHHHDQNQVFQQKPNWVTQYYEMLPAAVRNSFTQDQSSITTATATSTATAAAFDTSLLEYFSTTKSDPSRQPSPPHQSDLSSQCNNSANGGGGGAQKKASVQPSSIQSSFKVRKERMGDKITVLHQLVSPFGKTDTASVLLEAIGYIRFLQSQIEALSLPYMSSGSGTQDQPHSDSSDQKPKDLRSRGLCLVPVSCTLHVGNNNMGADYWTPAPQFRQQ
ncbi:hypothetical protein Dimus_038705 [Dionaea muscipula]